MNGFVIKERRAFLLQVFIAFLVLMVTSACKDDPMPDPIFYTIKADKNVMIADGSDVITLSATNRYNEDITSECDFFVNNTPLTGNTYSTSTVGELIFSALYKDVKSNNLIIEARTKYSFRIDKTSILADGIDRAVITVVDYRDIKKTDQTIFYINDQVISSNAFSTLSTGTYTMKAEIDGHSFTKEISAVASLKFTGRVLLEDFTGAWCGYCPRMTTAIEEAKSVNSNILVMAIHNGDFMATTYEAALRSKYNITGFPSALINRTAKWDERASTFLQFMNSDIGTGIAINSSLTGSLISAEITLRFNAPPAEQIKVAAYIIEDNIIGEQTNFYQDGRGNPIPNFNHSAVLREKMSSALLGDPVNTDGATTGSVITVNLTKAISPTWIPGNCKILVAVVKASNDQVINCQETPLGYSVGY